MRDAMSFDALLVALHDSLAAARAATRPKGEPEWMARLRQSPAARVPAATDDTIVDTHLAVTRSLHGDTPRVTEFSLSFECELYDTPQGLRLRQARQSFWRRPRMHRIEIHLRGGEPITTEVLIDGQQLRSERGRPISRRQGS